VVAVHERQVEAAAFAEEPRQRGLGSLRVVLHHLSDPRLLQKLQAKVREPRRLVGVDRDVARRRTAVPEQALADMKRRDAVAEANLDRLGRPLARDPLAQRLSLGGARRDREEVVDRAVRTREGGALANQALDHTAHPSQSRV
jgi:hypothetical protein